jgi:hypothetical protein
VHPRDRCPSVYCRVPADIPGFALASVLEKG